MCIPKWKMSISKGHMLHDFNNTVLLKRKHHGGHKNHRFSGCGKKERNEKAEYKNVWGNENEL